MILVGLLGEDLGEGTSRQRCPEAGADWSPKHRRGSLGHAGPELGIPATEDTRVDGGKV